MSLSPAMQKALERLAKGPADRWAISPATQRALVKRGLAKPRGYATYGYSSIVITSKGLEVLKGE